MADSLDGKVAIVTGGGSGIGEAVSLELARRGARVVVADIDGTAPSGWPQPSPRAAGEPPQVLIDVSREQDIRRLVEDTASAYGRLDYQFNNAGIAIGGDARDLTLDQWRRVLDVDLYGVLHGTLAVYPIMVGQGFGHIVNTSSAGPAAAAAQRSVPHRQARRRGPVPDRCALKAPTSGCRSAPCSVR